MNRNMRNNIPKMGPNLDPFNGIFLSWLISTYIWLNKQQSNLSSVSFIFRITNLYLDADEKYLFIHCADFSRTFYDSSAIFQDRCGLSGNAVFYIFSREYT